MIPKVKTKIALETTAGQGSCLGHRFEHIAHIIANVREPERICICLDTAHIFAAGYDIGSENAAKKTFRKFDRIIPQARDRLVAIHLNDSKAARGSRVDRHAHIGKGKIGLAAFRFIMNAPRFRQNSESAGNAEGQRTERRCGESENTATLDCVPDTVIPSASEGPHQLWLITQANVRDSTAFDEVPRRLRDSG